MDRIQTYIFMQFISKEFQEGISVRVVWLTIVALDHQ